MEVAMDEIVFYYPENHENHAETGHPERPERVEVMRAALQDMGVWDQYPHLEPASVAVEIIESVHDPDYLQRLEKASARGGRLDMDTYTTINSWDLALNTAGGAVAVANAVWHRQTKRGFALTRPPGHHATIDRGMGFCLLNNVAIAAEQLLQVEGAIKLAIIDLDLHHGNGTQDIFWTREDVLYISTHQYPHYPGTGNINDVGVDRGQGATANFPMPPMSGDNAFLAVMDEAILPLLDRFQPEMILVSYGFDTHWRDPLGHLLLSARGYGECISRLTTWADQNCGGRIALFLEGGYDLEAGRACAQGVVAALLGKDFDDPLGLALNSESLAWKQMLQQAKQIWGF
jgi:acetoin utilization deacetylase AcuC-like enzyme